MRSLKLVVLCATFALGAAESGAQAPRADLAAALTPGARVRVRASFGSATKVGVLGSRSGDTLTIYPASAADGVASKPIVVRIPDAALIDVSAGLAPSSGVGIVERALLGATMATVVTYAIFKDDLEPNLVMIRGGAGALLFAIAGPAPAPRERWLPVRSTGRR